MKIKGINTTHITSVLFSTTTPSCWISDYVSTTALSPTTAPSGLTEQRIFETTNSTRFWVHVPAANVPTGLTTPKRMGLVTCFHMDNDRNYPKFGDLGYTLTWYGDASPNGNRVDFAWVRANSDIGDWEYEPDSNLYSLKSLSGTTTKNLVFEP